MHEIDSILEKYPFVQRENLIPILQDIQDSFGYLSEASIVKVGKYLDLPTSNIYGLATFYNQFRFEAKGKYHIRVCSGTSCHIKSNALIIDEIEKRLGIKNEEITKDKLFSLEETTCMGACGTGPVMSVNNNFYTQMTIAKVGKVIDSYKQKEE